MLKRCKLISVLMCATLMTSTLAGVPVSAASTNGNGVILADFDTELEYEDWLDFYNAKVQFYVTDSFRYDSRYKLITDGSKAKLMDVEKRHPVSGFIKTNIGVFYATKAACELYNGVIKSGDKYYICNTGLLDGAYYSSEEAEKHEGIRCEITEGPHAGEVFVAKQYSAKEINKFKTAYKELKSNASNVMGAGVQSVYYKTLNGAAYIGNVVRTDTFSPKYELTYKAGQGTIRVETKGASDYKYSIYIKYAKDGKVYRKNMGLLGTDKDGAITFSWKLPKNVTMGAVYIESEGMIATYGFGSLNKSKSFKKAVQKQEVAAGFFKYNLTSEYVDIV